MIDSLFITSGSGSFVLEKHFRAHTPRSVCEPFLEKLRETEDPEKVPPVLCANRKHALVHTWKDNLFFLAVVTSETGPLGVIEMLTRMRECLSRYLGGDVSEDSIR